MRPKNVPVRREEPATLRKVLYALVAVSLVLVVNQITNPQGTTAGEAASPSVIATGTAAGTLEVRLSAFPSGEEYQSVVITVASVEVLLADGWTKLVPQGPASLDLKRVEGLEQTIATISLNQGTYTEMRLRISRADIALGNSPSIKASLAAAELAFKQNFQVGYKNTTVLVVSFDLGQSIASGAGGQISFDPSARLFFTRTPGTMELATTSLPPGRVGTAYSASLMAIGGLRPYSWSIWNGTLPSGLSLDPSTGTISGTPTGAGTFYLQFRADDSSPVMKSTIRYATLGAVVVTSNPDLSIQITP
jgi:hypothetical protein